jgi:uncharacterized RmlC-like cupin family protein
MDESLQPGPGVERREVTLLNGPQVDGAPALATLALPPHSADAMTGAQAEHAVSYYVLSGTLAATVADRTVIVGAGSALYVAPNTPHACWNPAAAPAVVLQIALPGA